MPAAFPPGVVRTPGETLSLSTTLASLGIPNNIYQVLLYNPTGDFRLSLNPVIQEVVFYDSSASNGSKYERNSGTSNSLTRDMTDRNTANGTGTALDSSQANVDFLYLRVAEAIGGIRIVIGSANGTSSTTFKGEYRKSDNTWANLSVTDGTDSGGVGLAQTGSVTWTVPTDHLNTNLLAIESLADTGAKDAAAYLDAPTNNGLWYRFSWDEALDSDTEIDEIWTLNAVTDRGYFRAATEYTISLDRRVVGAIEVVLASGTDTLQVTWMRIGQG